jgi:hypothetical protein
MLTLLAAVSASASAAASALQLLRGPSAAISPTWFGFNPGDDIAKSGPWTDAAFLAAASSLNASSTRFPSGTAANYWNWRQGCEDYPSGKCAGTSTLPLFAQFVSATRTTVTFVLNMLTDPGGLTSQLAFLKAAEAAGMPVLYVELGNEFYNDHPDNVKAFPTGADYGKTASTWLAAVRAAFPAAAISVVGVPSYRSGNNPRLTGWNAGLFKTLAGARPGDGVSMHEYDATGAGTGKAFTAADVGTMLGTPFAVAANINATALTLPAWASIWITEFNLLFSDANPKPDVPAFGTFAHALFVTLEALLYLDIPAVAAGRVNKHCLASYAYSGALFLDTTSFDFPLSPDAKLATSTWGVSGPGAALGLFGAASRGATSSAPLAFSPNPPVRPAGGGAAYPSLVGRAFAGAPAGAAALVVNLGSAPAALPAADVAGYASFVTLAAAGADPTVGVNNNSKLARASGATAAGVTLPPYSVLLLQA